MKTRLSIAGEGGLTHSGRGMLPLLATAIVAKAGNIYSGLWYPIVVSVTTFVTGALFVHETRHVRIHEEHALPAGAAAHAVSKRAPQAAGYAPGPT